MRDGGERGGERSMRSRGYSREDIELEKKSRRREKRYERRKDSEQGKVKK